MLLLSGMLIVWTAIVILIGGTLIYAALSAAPFIPMPRKDIGRLLALAELKPGEVVYELGCGDGRVLLAAARLYKVKTVGFEIALLPYLIAQLRRLFSSHRRQITIYYRNFWSVDLSRANVVFCFLMPAAMGKLASKLKAELAPGNRLVSYVFKLPGAVPSAISRSNKKTAAIYLYRF